MTEKEAMAVLGIEDPEEALDAYEMLIFDLQKFLLSNPVLLKTFQSRVKKAELIHKAFLCFEEEKNADHTLETGFVPDEVVSRHILNYFASKNKLKKVLATNPDFPATRNIVNQLIELERTFVKPFAVFQDWTEENVLVSKEPDIMEMLELIREQELAGASTLEQLHNKKENLPLILQKELKRLSLLTNYLYE